MTTTTVRFIGSIKDGAQEQMELPLPSEIDIPGHTYTRTSEEDSDVVLASGQLMYHYHLLRDCNVRFPSGQYRFLRGPHYLFMGDYTNENEQGGE